MYLGKRNSRCAGRKSDKGKNMTGMLFIIVIHVCDVCTSHFALVCFIFAILGERFHLKKMGRYFLRAVLPSGFCGYFFMYRFGIDMTFGYLLTSAVTWLCCTAAVSAIWKKDIWRGSSITCIASILQVSCSTVAATTIQKLVLQATGNSALYFFIFFVSFFPVIALISWFLYKINFCTLIRFLLEDEQHKRQKAVLVLALELCVELFFMFHQQLQRLQVINYIIGMVILTLLLIVILLYVSDKEESMRKIQYQESMLLQQQMYVEHLERMQKEMRAFRHDYKNILSGMYLYAQEGETEKIQKVLERLEIDFDQKIGEKIHVATQIGNIRLPEMKSLILTKLTKMTRDGTACRMEVLYPVSGISMDIWEFNQCLGILLDNAIEAVSRQPKPYIELQLMCHGGFLTVRVANPWEQEVDLSGIWKAGYSTKGEHRGLGLSNYKRILDQYPKAVSVTSWENRMFVQELTVPV